MLLICSFATSFAVNPPTTIRDQGGRTFQYYTTVSAMAYSQHGQGMNTWRKVVPKLWIYYSQLGNKVFIKAVAENHTDVMWDVVENPYYGYDSYSGGYMYVIRGMCETGNSAPWNCATYFNL